MDLFPDDERLLRILRRVCANRAWRLQNYAELEVTETMLAQQIAERLQNWPQATGRVEITDGLIERAVVNVYCHLLHRAVGLDHTAAQERAFAELWAYVTPLIGRVLRDEQRTAVCANTVLLILWRKRGAVQDPGSFLSYAAMIAGNAALDVIRQPSNREVSLSDLLGDGDEDDDPADALGGSPLVSAAPIFGQIEDADQIETLAGLIRKCLRRMRTGAEVVIRLVLLEQTAAEVAIALNRTAANIHLIKFRALDKLKHCPDLLAALGLSPAQPNGGAA